MDNLSLLKVQRQFSGERVVFQQVALDGTYERVNFDP